MPDPLPTYDYVAFIDEAGDPGISKVRPRDPNGGSEWLMIGGVLVEAKRELEPVAWVRKILVSVQEQIELTELFVI